MFKNRYDEDFVGKILFLLSIVILGLMNVVLFIKPFMETDEWFTKGLVQLPASQVVTITGIDVHPPLYYLIVKAPMKILSMMNMNYDLVFLVKFMSVVPFIILLIVCITKIRNDYGWLACGFFALSMGAMSGFFMAFLTARMYSWAILFLVLAFICVGDILKDSSYRSWILLAIFSTLAAYTHYFAAISAVVMYMLLLIYIIAERKSRFGMSDVKKWVISTVIGILLYLPWVFTLMGQLSSVHEQYWIADPSLNTVLTSISYIFTSNETFLLDVALAIVVLAIFVIVLARYARNKNRDNSYVLMGVSIYILTLAIALIVSYTFKPILLERYLFPSIAVFWLAVSILIGEIDFKKYAMPIIIIFLVFAAFSIVDQIGSVDHEYAKTVETQHFLDEINDNNTIVVFKGMQKYVRYGKELDNTEQYNVFKHDNKTYKLSYVKLLNLNDDSFNFPEDVYKNPDKQILYLSGDDKLIPSDLNSTRIFNLKGTIFYNITSDNPSSEII